MFTIFAIAVFTAFGGAFEGTFNFQFNPNVQGMGPVTVYAYVPRSNKANCKILIITHGRSGGAKKYRDLAQARVNDVCIFAPEVDVNNRPDQLKLSEFYTFGGMFKKVGKKYLQRPREKWTFRMIDALFEYVKQQLGNPTGTHDMIGMSAGAQFAHRYKLFWHPNHVDKLVVGSAGWFTLPDHTVKFPHGLKDTPSPEIPGYDSFLGGKTLITASTTEGNPVNKNPRSMTQGTSYVERATYMHEQVKQHGGNWELKIGDYGKHRELPRKMDVWISWLYPHSAVEGKTAFF